VFDAANSTVLKGVGVITAGDTTITGGNVAGTWTTGGAGTITITPNAITASDPTGTFTAGGNAAAAITVAAGGTLAVSGKIVLTTSIGGVTLTGGAAATSLVLNSGAVPGILDTGYSTNLTRATIPSPLTTFTIGDGTGTAEVTKSDGTTALNTDVDVMYNTGASDRLGSIAALSTGSGVCITIPGAAVTPSDLTIDGSTATVVATIN
jgi:hypothetical protein